ncbi:Protein phosphatase 2C family protein [Raphanus sativus]|nr:Protein phosphatase 2C family protein [Raphanus sativus]
MKTFRLSTSYPMWPVFFAFSLSVDAISPGAVDGISSVHAISPSMRSLCRWYLLRQRSHAPTAAFLCQTDRVDPRAELRDGQMDAFVSGRNQDCYLTNREILIMILVRRICFVLRRDICTLVKMALRAAAKKREVISTDVKKIERGVRRHFHDDIIVVVILLGTNVVSSAKGPSLSMVVTVAVIFLDTSSF